MSSGETCPDTSNEAPRGPTVNSNTPESTNTSARSKTPAKAISSLQAQGDIQAIDGSLHADAGEGSSTCSPTAGSQSTTPRQTSTPRSDTVKTSNLKASKQSRSDADNRISTVASSSKKTHGQIRNILKRPPSPTPHASPKHVKPKPSDSAPESQLAKGAILPLCEDAEESSEGSEVHSPRKPTQSAVALQLPLKTKAVSVVKEFDRSMKPKLTPRPQAGDKKQPHSAMTRQPETSPTRDTQIKPGVRRVKPAKSQPPTVTADKSPRSSDSEEEYGQGHVFQQFIMMEELVENLKLINYEKHYCRALSYKPINRFVNSLLSVCFIIYRSNYNCIGLCKLT